MCVDPGPSDGDSDPGACHGRVISSGSDAGEPRRLRPCYAGCPSETPTTAAATTAVGYRGSSCLLPSDPSPGSSKPRPAAELGGDPCSRRVGTAAWNAAASTGQRERTRRNHHACQNARQTQRRQLDTHTHTKYLLRGVCEFIQ